MSKLPVLDLRPCTRNSDFCLTCIWVIDSHRKEHLWIVGGEAQLLRAGDSDLNRGRWYLKMYGTAKGLNLVDREHDSAYALYIELIGVDFDSVAYQQTSLYGWITPQDPESFRVPKSNDLLSTGDLPCELEECQEDPHYMTDYYQPAPDAELYERLMGRRVHVTFAPVDPKEPFKLP